MARLVTSGFEQQSLVYGAEGQGLTPVGTPAIETTVKRSGGAALKVASLNGQHAVRFSDTTILADGWPAYVAGRAYYLRSYFRFSAAPASVSPPILMFQSGNTRQAEIIFNTSGQLVLRGGGGGTIQTSSALTANQWYRVELMIQQSSGTKTNANGTLEMRIDGVSVGGQQTSVDAGVLNVTRIVVGQNSTNPGITMYWDDVALNDDQGANQNSWPGDGYIVLLKPVSDTALIGNWKKGAGTNTANLYASVDNTPPTGKALASAADDDQIRISTGTPGTSAGNYEPTTAVYGAGKDIKVLQSLATIGNSTATTRSVGFRVQANPSGDTSVLVATLGAAGTFPTGWLTYRGNTIYDPSVDLSQGPRLFLERSETVEEQTVCALGAYVEYRDPIVLGQASETDQAQSISASKSVPVGLASETDVAQSVVAGKSATVGQSAETDAAQTVVSAKTAALGQAAETDSALSIGASRSAAIGQASETDAALDIAASKAAAVGQASETDAALPISTSQDKLVPVGLAMEADSALSITASKAGAVGVAVEVDTAQLVVGSKAGPVGQAQEADTAQSVIPGRGATLGTASETDAAQSISGHKTATAGLAQETDAALAITATRIVSVGQATETDLAQPIVASKSATLGLASETDSAQTIRSPLRVGIASETDIALPISAVKTGESTPMFARAALGAHDPQLAPAGMGAASLGRAFIR